MKIGLQCDSIIIEIRIIHGADRLCHSDKFIQVLGLQTLNDLVFIAEVLIKGRAVDPGFFNNLSHSDFFKTVLFQQK